MKRGRKWNMNSKYGKGKVMEVLRDHPGLSAKQICDMLGTKNTTVYRNLVDLVDDGYADKDIIFTEGPWALGSTTVFYPTRNGLLELEKVFNDSPH